MCVRVFCCETQYIATANYVHSFISICIQLAIASYLQFNAPENYTDHELQDHGLKHFLNNILTIGYSQLLASLVQPDHYYVIVTHYREAIANSHPPLVAVEASTGFSMGGVPDCIFSRPNIKEKIVVWLCKTSQLLAK